jgi:hypothetical protein
LTLVGAKNSNIDAEIWQLKSPPVGTTNVVVTATVGTSTLLGGATSFQGVDQTTPLGTPVLTSGSGGEASATVSSIPGELVVAVAAVRGGTTSTIGTGQTPLWLKTDGAGGAAAWGAASTKLGNPSVTMSWSVNAAAAGGWSEVAVAIKPATNTTSFPSVLSLGGSDGVTSNGFAFHLSVPVGTTYQILASTNLVDWTPISTNVATISTALLIDRVSTNYNRRFYRAVVSGP